MAISQIHVALETGKKRTFASALEWPGWARSGNGEAAALSELAAYESRYRRVISLTSLAFPSHVDLKVTQRLNGNTTTDFGAPDIAPSIDSEPVDAATLERFLAILGASWDTLGQAMGSASGKQLRKGPRGGGRTAPQIFDHVIGSHFSYLRQIYWRDRFEPSGDLPAIIEQVKQVEAQALEFAISGKMPEIGPRGGVLWKPRYFARRAAWHILDHAWEIEDKIEPVG